MPLDAATIAKIHSKARWGAFDELAELLKLEGAGIAQDQGTGNFPIHIAAQNGHLEIARLILANGGVVNAQNSNGLTALHMAVEYDYYWTTKMLIEAGADIEIVSDEGSAAKNGIEGAPASGVLGCQQTKVLHLFYAVRDLLGEGDIENPMAAFADVRVLELCDTLQCASKIQP
eukprot:SAG11_NODE_598_length_8269_cov_17.002448_1_plen_174_part_00